MHQASFFKTSKRYRWFIILVFLVFMLLHQADKLLIGPLTTDIMETFGITKTQMGAVSTGALIVGAIFFPLWGYLYDRYARAKLLALASFLWGATTWLNALAPTYSWFLATRASTGIDDSSYPGLYSLVSDYFEPNIRGKVYGLLQLTGPIGYLLGMILGLTISGMMGWRGIFFLTGSLGVVVAVVVFFFVKEAPRGQSEPEIQDITETINYHFEWSTAKNLLHNKTLLLVMTQGFFGVFPWNAITYWFFNYLETERGYSSNETLVVMAIAVIILAAGYPLGGALGDAMFKRTQRGRMYVGIAGVFIGAVLFTTTISLPHSEKTIFLVMMGLSAIFIPFPAPNVISTVYDITLPEIRSTAVAAQSFVTSIGAALSPLLVGLIADAYSLEKAFLWICSIAWVICGIIFIVITRLVPKDINNLRMEMKRRADLELSKNR